MKIEIIVDCNSFSHLSLVEINRQGASTWLWKYFDVRTSSIVRDEFSVGIQKASSSSKAIKRKLDNNDYIIQPSNFQNIQSNWLAKQYYKKNLSNEDEGERHLICSIIELHFYKKIPRCVLVTDDFSAVDYFIQNVQKDTYFGSIWTSIDLLVYLYFYQKGISFDEIFEGIRDIISMQSFSARRFKEKGNTDEFARQSMLSSYLSKLNSIKLIKQTLP